MTKPAKVVAFLDLFGEWDPSLMLVMAGAVGVHFLTYRLIRKRKTPWFSGEWHVPTKKEITPSLIVGSLLFGIGWGLGGFCPGPALVSLASFEVRPLIFVVAMIVGMYLFRVADSRFHFRK